MLPSPLFQGARAASQPSHTARIDVVGASQHEHTASSTRALKSTAEGRFII